MLLDFACFNETSHCCSGSEGINPGVTESSTMFLLRGSGQQQTNGRMRLAGEIQLGAPVEFSMDRSV